MRKDSKLKRLFIGFLGIALVAIWLVSCSGEAGSGKEKAKAQISEKTAHCISCHGEAGNGKVITQQWKESRHAQMGVGCIDCHKAEEGDVDGFEHHGDKIATIVTPNDCAKCHKKESDEFQASHHADAGMIMGSLDNVLAEVIEGHTEFNGGANPAAASGCWQCHGSTVALLKDESGNPIKNEEGVLQFDPKTWPNTGVGRINLDGSKGSCSACHSRHSFSSSLSRQPENCGKCHMGPDHPQIEIYNESKHGIAYRAFREDMNLDAQPWIVGQDYSAAPTCATCHMSATPNQPITHEIGARISWTLRPKVSEKVDVALKKKFKKLGKPLPEGFLTWEQRRANMQDVCTQCHNKGYVDNFYVQFDNMINLYNEKFGKPALKIFNLLGSTGLRTKVKFDDEIEWTYFFLWHHEGRRARHGVAMMGPDYTQWHGNYEVAHRFYMEFVPQVKELIKHADNKAGAKEVQALLDEVLNSDMHKWFLGKEDPEALKKRNAASKAFRERYSH